MTGWSGKSITGVTFGILVDVYDLPNTLFSFFLNDGNTFWRHLFDFQTQRF